MQLSTSETATRLSITQSHCVCPAHASRARFGTLFTQKHRSYVGPGHGASRRRSCSLEINRQRCIRVHTFEFDPDEYKPENLDPDEYQASPSVSGAPGTELESVLAHTPRQNQQLARKEEVSAGSTSAAHASTPVIRGASVATSSAPQTQPANKHTRVLSALAAAPRALAVVPRESWNAVTVTCAAAWALLGEIGAAGAQLAGLQANACRQAAAGTRVGRTATSAKQRWVATTAQLPEGIWNKIMWLWDCPPIKQLRITMTMAQWSVRIPAIIALFATQGGLLATQVSLPMLAPLLVGTGMLLRTVMSNASFIFPRVGLMVIMTWGLWFTNRVIQNTAVYLRRQGTIDHQLSGSIITVSECTAMVSGGVILLTLLGVNVSALLVPAALAVAYAAKDLSHNFLAGFFLFAAQPFRRGDRVAVSSLTQAAAGASWFEGICEKVDLRYTVVRNGKRRLYVPNSTFLTREFMVVDDPEARSRHQELSSSALAASSAGLPYSHAYVHGPDGHPRWMGGAPYDPYYMNGRSASQSHAAPQPDPNSRDQSSPPSPPSNDNGSGSSPTRSNGTHSQQQSTPEQPASGSPYSSRPPTPSLADELRPTHAPDQQSNGSGPNQPYDIQPGYYQHVPHPGFAAYGQPTAYWSAPSSPFTYHYGMPHAWGMPEG